MLQAKRPVRKVRTFSSRQAARVFRGKQEESLVDEAIAEVIENFKLSCIDCLEISLYSDDPGEVAMWSAAGLAPSLVQVMLEVAGNSIEFGDRPGWPGKLRNVEIRAKHALDLLRRIEAKQLPDYDCKDRIAETKRITINGELPHTKRVLYQALWRGCGSDDLYQAALCIHALLGTRTRGGEDKLFRDSKIADFHFKHGPEALGAILASHSGHVNGLVAGRIVGWGTRGSDETNLQKVFAGAAKGTTPAD